VGLDLGSQSIKLVELERTASGLRLVKSLVQELPTPRGGQVIDRVGWLQSALKEFNAREVYVSVNGPQVVIRRVHMPLMSKGEMPEAVKWQMKEQIPYPVQDAVVDFRVVRETWDKDIKKQDVLVAVASTPLARELITVVERAGVRVASLSPTQLAMWRCVTTLIPEVRQGSVAVIEIGAQETEVTIAKDGHICVVRNVAVGSLSMTKALVGVVASEDGEVTIDYSKAEALKRRYGVFTEIAEGTMEEGVPLFHLASLMRPVLENLLTELSRLFDFYKVEIDEAGVSRVLLCGGGANLKQLQPFMADGLGLTVEILNPLMRIPEQVQGPDPDQVAESGPRLAVAIGLALDHGEGLNLLPADMQRAKASAASRSAWRMTATALAAVALLLSLALQIASGVLQRQVRREEAEWARLEPVYAKYLTSASTLKTLEGTIGHMQQFLDRLDGWSSWKGLFKELGGLVPSTIKLDEMTVAIDEQTPSGPLRIRLRGRVASEGGAEEGNIAQFVEALEHSIFFADMDLSSSEMHSGQTGTTSFEIEGRLE
jgi:type IV pilus assembly protein PilM